MDLTPQGDASNADEVVEFRATYQDANGAEDLQEVRFRAHNDRENFTVMTLSYDASDNTLWARDEYGAWIGGFSPGSDETIETRYFKLNVRDTTVTRNGDQLEVKWTVRFTSRLGEADMTLLLHTFDREGEDTGYEEMGEWHVHEE
ncbi:MAG: hypothetical protein WKH64_08565 [Chloroflexia bacterium]